jgi:signal transduction histidine kinase
MFLVVTGVIEGYEEIGGQPLIVATTGRGQATGMLPFSRMTHYPRYTVAVEPSQVLRVDKRDFREMVTVAWEVVQRLVAEMSDRVRGDVRLEQQQAKMLALGRLSAGLAHELNNPAAAVGRAAATLSAHLAKLPECVTGLIRLHLDETAIEAIHRLPALVGARESAVLSPLERGDREEKLTAWLEARGVAEGWEIAGTFTDAGLSVEDLEGLEGKVPAVALGDAIGWVECGLAAERVVGEIASAAERISTLIASVKTYSHMDRSPEHKPTDVREGLDNTLTMLRHKLEKKSIRLERDYQQDLPMILGNAGELNQVWTNLIDNAIDAIEIETDTETAEGGELHIVARQEESRVEVHIIDNGPGIPDDVRPRIFDPFFTTKAIGDGSGLGLDIALRIVRTHHGHIDVQSSPGRTAMRVLLPVSSGSG